MMKKEFVYLLFLTFFVSCDTARTLYKSPRIDHLHYRIKVVNITHCGCNELYVKHYSHGVKDFIIFYGQGLPSKLLFTGDKRKNSRYQYVTQDSVNAIRFDPIDKEIFDKIDSLISAGHLRKLHHPHYWGYKKDTPVITN